jgi:invasion protein IalB
MVTDRRLLKSNNLLLIIGGAVLLVLVGVGAFLAGQHYAPTTVVAVPGQARAPVRFTRLPPQKFENWTLNCIRGPRGGQRCGLVLSVVDQSRTHLMLRLDVLRSAKGPAMVVVAPPNTLLTAGFTITPDKAQPTSIPFTRCMPRACEAVFVMSDTFRRGLSSAPTAQIHYVTANGRPVDHQIPIKGFEAGYAAWQTQDQAVASAASAPKVESQAGAPNAGAPQGK